ncbi:Lysine 2,3-aminomutase [Marinobacter nitratireducens]|uniref:L-lysine 2,3-aminomutase n=1 Tax=Marinobacter nitratireducens TaxID=1137280 RepID=A0A072N1W2_9GAMM|nr:EF-P beta-lysylation protein EpmB [Marinobacter nitratireducens]KEF31521.1 Lysine 2,3-aminomutase [Marinobacter nitratireducens]
MIQRTPARIEAHLADDTTNWQQLLSESVTSPEELLRRLDLPASLLEGARAGNKLFPIRVPEPFLARINKGDPSDPLLRQILPLTEETEVAPGFVNDPLRENVAIQSTGLIRKYRSRALIMVTGQCAINCRYCFRRHFPYEEQRLSPEDRQAVIDTLGSSPEVNEVIFSGGDPLAVNDRLLEQWVKALGSVPHIRRLRIHSRLPVVIPQRVCDSLLKWVSRAPFKIIMVLHINHAAEIDHNTRRALGYLRAAGVTLLNQSVILRGVNDKVDVLEALSESLFDAGVLPYYLHAFDPVSGAHHYDVSDEEARQLVRGMLARLPGFLVPKLVREIPGEPSKTPINLFP